MSDRPYKPLSPSDRKSQAQEVAWMAQHGHLRFVSDEQKREEKVKAEAPPKKD